MAKQRKVICQYCRQHFSREEELFEHTSKGYYHKTCYDTMQEERAKRAGITDLLEQLTPGKVNYPLVQKQIKEFTEKFNYTESGLLGTLYYLIDVKKKRLTPESGIALLPYFYNEARDYYKGLKHLEQVTKIEYKTKEVVVPPQKTKRLEKLIDLDSLLSEEENKNV